MSTLGKAFEELTALVEFLRGPDGCPWDRRQTHDSLLPYLLEETYEVVAALDEWAERPDKLREELGDLLLQVLLHSVIAAERGAFTLEDVVKGLHEKLVRRHPHVFGDKRAGTPSEVIQLWEQIKSQEQQELSPLTKDKAGYLDNVSGGLPPAARAYALQQQASQVGFDWAEPVSALAKVKEELQELEEAVAQGQAAGIHEEAGDVLFSLINVVRLLGHHPDEVLATANRKFTRRFSRMEAQARLEGRRLEDMSLADMDKLWDRIKSAGDGGNS